ncbi:hypothetical protein LSH36_162g05037, partial [Paralvinella palmiformis]
MNDSGRGKNNWSRRGSWRGRGRCCQGRGSWQNRDRGNGFHGNRGQWQGKNNSSQHQLSFEGSKDLFCSQSSQPHMIQTTLLDMHTPYKGWNLYFPEQGI